MKKMLVLLLSITLSLSSAMAINVLTDDPDYAPGDDYIEYDVLIDEGCGFIEQYEDKIGWVTGVRWYYLFNQNNGRLLASYKVTKVNNCEVFQH